MTKPLRPLAWLATSMALVTSTLVGGGCGGSSVDPDAPAPTLAETAEAARAFRRVETRWEATAAHRRVVLLPELDGFLERFPDDPTARRVRLYAAWLRVESGELDRASATVDGDRGNPAGVDADLATVIRAAVLDRRGSSKKALALLRPLRGKIIDANDRILFSGELVRAALDAKRYRAAVTYMLDFAEHAGVVHGEEVKAIINDQIRRVPSPALEQALADLSAPSADDGARAEARRWLAKAVRGQLVRWALAREDVELAKRLLDRIPSSLRLDDTREALRRLAARGNVDPRVEGRAVGLVLEVFDDVSRRRSAAVATAMADGLELHRAGRSEVRFLSREASSEDEVERALAGLAGDGAAILVAGVTPESVETARAFARGREIPVLLMGPSSKPLDAEGFAFQLGDDPSREVAAVDAWLRNGKRRSEIVVGPSAAVSCDVPPAAAGSLRFPVVAWKRAGIDTLVLIGDERCANEVIAEAREAEFFPALTLGLEAGTADTSGFTPVMRVSAGGFRADGTVGSGATWYAALGGDAARLGAAALADFPLEQTREEAAVAELHRRARDSLARVEVALVSADAKGFAGGRVLPRTFRVVTAGKVP